MIFFVLSFLVAWWLGYLVGYFNARQRALRIIGGYVVRDLRESDLQCARDSKWN